MASGKAHIAASVVVSAPLAAIAFFVAGPTAGLGAVAGCLAETLIGPDLDQIDQAIIHTSERKMIRYLPVIGYLWLALWDPYARLIPHRSALSHFPLLGTAGRAAYMYGVARLLGMKQLPLTIDFWMGFLGGLAVSDFTHWMMDGGPVKLPGRRGRMLCRRSLRTSASG